MSTHEANEHGATGPESVMRAQISAMIRGDVDAVLALFAPAATFLEMGDPATRHEGRDAIRPLIEDFVASHDLSRSSIEFRSIASRGRTVLSELRFDCHYIGPGAEPGGIRVRWDSVVVDEIDGEGLIVEERAYLDPKAIERQIGIA